MVPDMFIVLYVLWSTVEIYKPAFCTWIHVLLKSAATSHISNLILYKNISSLTEILMLFHQKLLKEEVH